jgi:hypothetical protein
MGWEIGRDGESIESLWGRRSSGWCGGAAGTVVALAWQGRNPQQRRRRLWVRALLGWAGPQTSRSLTGFSLFFPFFFVERIVDGFRVLVELTLWNNFLVFVFVPGFWKNVENTHKNTF